MDEDLASYFGSLPADVGTELHAMLRLHNINAEELFYKWESYCMKMGPDTRPTLDTVAAFRKDVRDQLEKEMRARSRTQQHQTPARRKPAAAAAGADWMMDELAPSVKRKLDKGHEASVKASRGPGGGPVKGKEPSVFSARTSAGEVVEVLNEHLPRPAMPQPGVEVGWEARVRLVANVDIKRFGFRTMYQKLMEAAEVMDDRIDDMMAAVQEHHGLADEAFGNPSTVSPAEVVAVGRIVSDSLDGKLNHASVLLEASRRMGAGARVPLKLDAVKSFSFFPGQIVAVRGINASGAYFAVTEILDIPPLPLPASTAEALAESASRLAGAPLAVVVASGPYTTEDNLDFEALDELCERAARERPDVVILTGPFIDSEHPLVKTGDFDLEHEQGAPIDDLFRERVSTKIQKIKNSMVILIPAVTDAISAHVAYPQDVIKKRFLDLPSNVRRLPNPATFSLNEVVFAVSTPDILLHLSSAECRHNPAEPHPIARLSRSLMAQRNYYPLFPPAQGVNMDVPYCRLAEFASASPDVLVLPSVLAPTVKVVEGVVVLNAGAASRRRAAGNWVRLWVGPRAGGGGEGEGEGGVRGHRVFERARVEVVRI
ncbi:DNA polymerase alpha subunit B N-terminal-domain-containing protein [Morchella snyderi]|nr:DNA polymerase alpha subunit B N-terminal-domain-containing protein [Morchella snyderi]